jgi:hypothetical protein
MLELLLLLGVADSGAGEFTVGSSPVTSSGNITLAVIQLLILNYRIRNFIYIRCWNFSK